MRRSKLKKIKACSTKNLRARTRIKFNLGLYYLISLPRLLFQAMFDQTTNQCAQEGQSFQEYIALTGFFTVALEQHTIEGDFPSGSAGQKNLPARQET